MRKPPRGYWEGAPNRNRPHRTTGIILRAGQAHWCAASRLGRPLALDFGQLRPDQPLAPALSELRLRQFERRRVAIHAHVRRRAKNAGDRPEPLKIRGRAAFFINPTHGKFATEEGVIAAVFFRRRAKARRAKRETHALLPTALLRPRAPPVACACAASLSQRDCRFRQ